MFSVFLALAFWAGSAAAAVLSVIPQAALAPLGVPALILGGPAAMPAPLSQALQTQTALLAGMPPPLIAPHLISLAASPVPVERAAAKLLAHGLAKEQPALAPLAESAEKDPAFSQWFDGAGKAPSFELDGLVYKKGYWRSGEEKLPRLGRGEFGFVDVHPRVEGAVMKTVAHSEQIQMFSTDDPDKTWKNEEETANLLAAADAGPRHFGRATPGGYRVSLRERVYGDTLEGMFRARSFGQEERELVHDLVRRLAKADLMVNDLRPANIMIGRTLLDPRRRAYVVDGGSRVPLPAGLDLDGRAAHILREPIVLRGRFDRNIGWIEYAKSLSYMMDEGIARRNQVTRWQKFRGFLSEILQHY